MSTYRVTITIDVAANSEAGAWQEAMDLIGADSMDDFSTSIDIIDTQAAADEAEAAETWGRTQAEAESKGVHLEY